MKLDIVGFKSRRYKLFKCRTCGNIEMLPFDVLKELAEKAVDAETDEEKDVVLTVGCPYCGNVSEENVYSLDTLPDAFEPLS